MSLKREKEARATALSSQFLRLPKINTALLDTGNNMIKSHSEIDAKIDHSNKLTVKKLKRIYRLTC